MFASKAWQSLLLVAIRKKRFGNIFRAIGFFNEADTLESSSILIFFQKQSIYTQQTGGKSQ
jgi:hypothetical protein